MSRLKTQINSVKQDANAMSLLKSGGLVLFFKVLGALAGYIFTIVVGRMYGAAVYGIFEMSFTILMIASVVVKLGLDTANVRFTTDFLVKKEWGKIVDLYKKSVLTIVFTSIVAGITIYALRYQFEHWFAMEGLGNALTWVALCVLPFACMQFNAEALRGFKSMTLFSIFQQGSVLLLAAGIVILLPKDFLLDRSKATMAFASSAVVLMVLSFIGYTKTRAKIISGFKRASSDFPSIVRIGIPLLVSGSLFLVMSWTDVLMIGYFETEADVGVYRTAFKVATLITFTQFAVNSIAAPTIAQHYSEQNMNGLRKYVRQIGWVNLITSLPIFIIIVLFREFLLQLIGDEFAQGAYLIPVLAIGQLVNALCGPVMYILNMTGKERLSQRIMLWMAIANLVLNFILIPIYGILGAAIATSASMIAWNVIAAGYVYKYYEVISFPWVKR